jgi:hypothetical protein
MIQRAINRFPTLTRHFLHGLMAMTCVAVFPYSAPAEARWGHRGGWFAGGLVLGAVLAPRYAYPAPVYYYPPPAPTYYPPPVYYTPPPPVIYTQPPVVVQPSPPVVVAPHAQAQPTSIEDRLRRLRNLCDQGLLTPHECQTRREEVLREL